MRFFSTAHFFCMLGKRPSPQARVNCADVKSEERAMRMGSKWGAMLVAVAVTAGATSVVMAQAPAPKTYTATATVKTAGGASMTAPVTITISRWTTDAERTTALAALKKGDAALKTALAAMPATGTIQVGGRST